MAIIGPRPVQRNKNLKILTENPNFYSVKTYFKIKFIDFCFTF